MVLGFQRRGFTVRSLDGIILVLRWAGLWQGGELRQRFENNEGKYTHDFIEQHGKKVLVLV
jgi:hypothetical protein